MKDEIKKNSPGRNGFCARAALRAFFFILLPSSFILSLVSGCQIFGALSHAVPETNRAAYVGLAGQSVGVMVWADRAVLIDWNTIQLDLANVIQEKLRTSKTKEAKGITFPYPPASIVKYQRNHPGIEATPITEVAPQLGASRLIYIELESFSTRSDTSSQMFRGNATASIKIVEVTGREGKIAFEESSIHSVFPPKSPQEGIVNSSDVVIYKGTLVGLADQIVDRLTTHEVD